jgi:hypothetical protein
MGTKREKQPQKKQSIFPKVRSMHEEVQMELINPKHAAKYLGISPRTLESMRLRGVGPTYIRVGRLVRYLKDALEGWVLSNQWNSTSDEKAGRATPAHPSLVPDLTHCEICHRKMTPSDINIAGFGSDGQPRSVGHCCIDKLESALLIGIPRDTPESGFSRVIQYLESRQIDAERVKRVHSEGQRPYALHVFSRNLYQK